VNGKFVLPAGRTLAETLNGPSIFMEFEPVGEARSFVAKSALHAIKPLD
jgi:hypothetical protein